jgi:hypothetical protein
MRLLSAAVVSGLLSVPVPREAVAAPVMIAVSQIVPALGGGSIESVYYYRGGYYPYRYRGVYFRHRYYRHGRWHYY